MAESGELTHSDFDPSKELGMECDSLPCGVGAVLSYRAASVDNQAEFRSRTLSQVEVKYSHVEREAMTLILDVQRFREYWLGTTFTLMTCHKSLKAMVRECRPKLMMATGRFQHGALTLCVFMCRIKYKPGTRHANADALS